MQVDRWASILRRHQTVAVLVTYSLLTIVMTYPQAFRLADGVHDGGDPLLNTWIMWWEVDSVVGGNLGGFFDANMFFPHFRTLAYSEFLVPQTLLATPLLLLFDNPLIAYNVVLLASFVATAFAMYLLGKYLTGGVFAGFVSGLALAFAPFMFAHLSHLQIIGAAGIPMAFYFLHRYFDEGSVLLLLGFSGAYIAQSLANAYYALYLTYAAGAFILYRAVLDRRLGRPSFYGHMGLHAVLSIAALGPFFGQYVLLRRELGFVREMAFQGGWYSFFAAPPLNRLYGDLTEPLRAPEAALFPGLCVAALAGAGVLASRNLAAIRGRMAWAGKAPEAESVSGKAGAATESSPSRERGIPQAETPSNAARWGYGALGALIVAEWLAILAITVTGGIDTTVAGIGVRAHGLWRPIVGLALAIMVRALMRRRFAGLGRGATWLREPQRFYGCMMFVVLLLTLGPDGPYRLLYALAPGFDGVRAVPRIHILTVFCLAVFVAYGIEATVEWLKRRHYVWVALALPAVMLVEFFSAPVPMFHVRWGAEAPAVYGWLAQQEGDFAVVEYPIDPDLEFDRLYYSTVHRKMLVNGTSGYWSPVYAVLRDRMWAFPSAAGIEDLRELGVRWVIIHPEKYVEYWPERERRLVDHGGDLRLVADVDGALVLELRDTNWLSREEYASRRRELPGTSIPRDDWTVTASINELLAELAVDGDISTRWSTEIQAAGDFYQVDFGREVEFDLVVTRLHDHPRDYPRGYRVEVSDDGSIWNTVSEDPGVYLGVTEVVERRLEIDLPLTRARYLRLVQTGEDPVYWWSIHELDVRRRDGG